MESKAVEEKDSHSEKPENVVLKNASQIVLLASSLLVVISVLYNLAYFQIIAPEYFNLLTVNDHINAALGWLAYTPLALLPTIIWHYFFRIQDAFQGIIQGKLGTFLRKRANLKRLLKIISSKKWVKVVLVCIEILCIILLIGPIYYLLQWEAYPYAKSLIAELGFGREVHNYLKLITVSLLSVFIIAYGAGKLGHWFVRFLLLCSLILIPVITGKIEAQQALSAKYQKEQDKKDLYNLQTSSGVREHIVIMRSIEKGLIFRDTHHSTVSFITWDKIQDLSSYPSLLKPNEAKKEETSKSAP